MVEGLHTDHVTETEGIVDDTDIETYYRPLEYVSVPVPFKPYLRVVCDDGPVNIETRIPFDMLIKAGWTPPTNEQIQERIKSFLAAEPQP